MARSEEFELPTTWFEVRYSTAVIFPLSATIQAGQNSSSRISSSVAMTAACATVVVTVTADLELGFSAALKTDVGAAKIS
jgi:hypothetical protein